VAGQVLDIELEHLHVCVCVCVCVSWWLGANCGHYTAYTRHPMTNEWFYSNDETVVRQTPHDADYSSIYILFYQRRGSYLIATDS